MQLTGEELIFKLVLYSCFAVTFDLLALIVQQPRPALPMTSQSILDRPQRTLDINIQFKDK
jgi:hypothetical protein